MVRTITRNQEHVYSSDAQEYAQSGLTNSDSLTETLKNLVTFSQESESQQISIKQIMEAFGSRAHGPLLLLPAVIALFPITGGIPGMSMLTATIIILVALQMLFSRGSIWLPGFVKKRSISQERLEKLVDNWQPWTEWLDRAFTSRLEFLTRPPFSQGIAVLCIGLALTMYPLAFVPMGAAPPSFTIMLLALALIAQDGIMGIVGTIVTLLCAVATYFIIDHSWETIREGLSWLGLA